MNETGEWTARVPGLTVLDDELRQALTAASRVVQLPAGSRVFGLGQVPDNFLIVLEGSVRVQQVSESGREIVLYRVTSGESCPLTTACLMSHEQYLAEAVAETAVRGVVVPRGIFDKLIAQSSDFRRFVFAAFSHRMISLFRLIENVAFARVDIRLAQKLIALADESGTLALTHQQLASELGTAREVISRQLNEFQRRGWVAAGRGSITLIDRDALAQLANEA
ncbi:MAG: Crp/Fnr family transcriptional regulator [Alphaproteobacteria bacterium]